MAGAAAYNKFPPVSGVGWNGKQWLHAQSRLGNLIDDYAWTDFINPGEYTLNGQVRMNKGKGRVTSSGAGNAFASLGAGVGVSVLDNPLTESWYISCHGCVALSPSATAFIYAIAINGVAAGLDGIVLSGAVSQTKFNVWTQNGGTVNTAFAASVGSEIQLAVDYDFALEFNAQLGQLTAFLDQGQQAVQTNLTQISPTVANILNFQLNQTGVFECDSMFFAFKR